MAHTQQKVESHSNLTNSLLCKYFNQLTIHILVSLNVGDWELYEALVEVVITWLLLGYQLLSQLKLLFTKQELAIKMSNTQGLERLNKNGDKSLLIYG